MHALKNLAGHHLGPVVNELLNVQTLPHPDHVAKCFQGIAKDPTLLVQMLAHVCDAMNNSVLFKEVGKHKISQHRPMAATAALADILNEPAAVDVFRSKVHNLVLFVSICFEGFFFFFSVRSNHGNDFDAHWNECGTETGGKRCFWGLVCSAC